MGWKKQARVVIAAVGGAAVAASVACGAKLEQSGDEPSTDGGSPSDSSSGGTVADTSGPSTSTPTQTSGSSTGEDAGSTGDVPQGCVEEPLGMWTPTSMQDVPPSRSLFTAVWTTTDVILWGGLDRDGYATPGYRYTPQSDTWQPIADSGQPEPRSAHTAVWTGSEMIVWGGAISLGINMFDFRDDGGRYDPVTDTWAPTTQVDAPLSRIFHRAVWTGAHMIVWGGSNYDLETSFDSGGRYDSVLDEWRATSLDGAPSPRSAHSLAWTGTELFVWGGYGLVGEDDYGWLNDGALYDPLTDTWRPVTTDGAPSPRKLAFAAWADGVVLVYGGCCLEGGNPLRRLARYDPEQEIWLEQIEVCEARSRASIVWTGSELLVWGGTRSANKSGDGILRVAPAGEITRASLPGEPEGYVDNGYVWTDFGFWIWGGGTQSGGLYSPD